MPAKLIPPIEETFELERSDKELGCEGEPTSVKIKQASQGEHDERSDLWSRFDRRFSMDDSDVVFSQRVSPAEVRRLEVYLTMVDCNILNKEGKPLFTFPLKKNEFYMAWSQLPSLVAEEIHEKVLAVNVGWAGQGEAR